MLIKLSKIMNKQHLNDDYTHNYIAPTSKSRGEHGEMLLLKTCPDLLISSFFCPTNLVRFSVTAIIFKISSDSHVLCP